MENPVIVSTSDVESRSFITRVYGWMSLGLALTGWISWFIGNSPDLLGFILGNKVIFYGLVIGEFALVMGLSGWVRNMTVGAATLAFLFYAAMNGATLSVIFLIYTASSIASTFFLTSATFGFMSLYGYTTKTDLTRMGNILFMGLIGIVLASVVNMFMQNAGLQAAISYIGVLVFVGLTAYDTQKIKNMGALGGWDSEEEKKGAIMGALALYLDFVNLFLMLLRTTGRRK